MERDSVNRTQNTHPDEDHLMRTPSEHLSLSGRLFILQFYEVASLQGRLAYLLMSIHCVNPSLIGRYFDSNPYPYLFSNMIYGHFFLFFSRLSFMGMPFVQRMTYSILGSYMFNHASLLAFEHVAENWGLKSDIPSMGIATFISFMYGRIFAGELISYLDYIDNKVLHLMRRIQIVQSRH